LQAQGLGFEQLPELTLAAPDGAEIYPDKPDTRTRDDGTWLYGERVRKFAFVPSRPGSLTIPGVSVRWWDTAHDRAETVELPARTIKVLPAVGKPATGSATGGAASQADNSAVDAAPATPATKGATPASLTSLRIWQMLALLALVLWLATLALWWRSRRAATATSAQPAPHDAGSSAHRAVFLRACSLGEIAGAERALIAWARSERPDVRNIGELTGRLQDPAQHEALAALQRARFAGAPTLGVGAQLERAFKGGLAWRKSASDRKDKSPLPALYPE
jgi:hypothetical protein